MNRQSQHQFIVPAAPGLVAFAAGLLLLPIPLIAFLDHFWPLVGWWNDQPFPASIPWLLDHVRGSFKLLIQAHESWLFDPGLSALLHQLYNHAIDRYDLTHGLTARIGVVAIASLTGALFGARYVGARTEPRDALAHIRGRRLWVGRSAKKRAKNATRLARKRSGSGVFIAPQVPLARDQEVQPIGIFGTTGSGKTTIFRFLQRQIVDRGDRILVHDSKGDVLAGWPSSEFTLLAPHDDRSAIWDIASDVSDPAAAREFASHLIPDTSEPMWSNAGRAVLAGLIQALQARGDWGFSDLQEVMFQSAQELRRVLEESAPDAARLIEFDENTGTFTRTGFGIILQVWSAGLKIVQPLAQAWPVESDRPRISLRQWLLDETSEARTIILQRAPALPELSQAWIGAATDLIARTAAGPELSPSRGRRIWLHLDELAQLGKLNRLPELLAVGREKGICTVLGLQSPEQLNQAYGARRAKAMLDLMAIKIIGRLPSGETTEQISKNWIGNRKVMWSETTRTSSWKSWFEEPTRTKTVSHHTADEPVVPPAYLDTELGPWRLPDGWRIKALVLGLGDVFSLDWPFAHWPQRRAASKPAGWCDPNHQVRAEGGENRDATSKKA